LPVSGRADKSASDRTNCTANNRISRVIATCQGTHCGTSYSTNDSAFLGVRAGSQDPK
jgi:hypothetical protein